MRPKPHCLICGFVKSAAIHGGAGWEHDFEGEAKPTFGSTRAPLNPRSEKRATYYREERIPAVKAAVGDGRKACGLMHELDGTLRYIQVSPACTGYVQGIHEVASRGRFGGLEAALRSGPTVDCCHACNRFWSEHPREAEAAGLLMKNRVAPLFDQDEEEAL